MDSELMPLDSHPRAELAFSTNGRWLAAMATHGHVHLWDVQQRTLSRTFSPLSRRLIDPIAVAPDGSMVARVRMSSVVPGGGNYRWAVELHDAVGENMRSLPMGDLNSGLIRSIAFSPDSKSVACSSWRSYGGEWLRVWEAKSGALVWELHDPSQDISSLSFSPDGRVLAVGSEGGAYPFKMARLFDSRTGDLLDRLPTRDETVHLRAEARFSRKSGRGEGRAQEPLIVWPDGRGQDGRWPGEAEAEGRGEFVGHFGDPPSFNSGADGRFVDFLPDGRLAASGEGNITLWDASLERPLLAFFHSYHHIGCVISADGRRLAIPSSDWGRAAIDVWSIETPFPLRCCSCPTGADAFAFSADGATLATVGGDGRGGRLLRLWPVPNPAPSST